MRRVGVQLRVERVVAVQGGQQQAFSLGRERAVVQALNDGREQRVIHKQEGYQKEPSLIPSDEGGRREIW